MNISRKAVKNIKFGELKPGDLFLTTGSTKILGMKIYTLDATGSFPKTAMDLSDGGVLAMMEYVLVEKFTGQLYGGEIMKCLLKFQQNLVKVSQIEMGNPFYWSDPDDDNRLHIFIRTDDEPGSGHFRGVNLLTGKLKEFIPDRERDLVTWTRGRFVEV